MEYYEKCVALFKEKALQRIAEEQRQNVTTQAELDEQIRQESIKKQIENIKEMLEENFSNGEMELRLLSHSIYPEVVDYFRVAGFVVFYNDEVCVIRIIEEDVK